MVEEVIGSEDAPEGAPGTEEAVARERSRIGFPYNDLDDAIGVAQAVWDHVGAGQAEVAQVGAWLKHDSITSGAFRLKIAAAKMFGLIETGQNSIVLTKLGRQIVDPNTVKEAKVSAFLAVPLYDRLYRDYSTGILPNAIGLERVMAELGVPGKQTDKARQAFQRSAASAGFFAEGNNKLVRPGLRPREDIDPKPDHTQHGGGHGGGGDQPMHPFVKGLVDTLPAPGSAWADDARHEWLTAAEAIFRLIYKEGSKQD